jgi:hypothetical protein
MIGAAVISQFFNMVMFTMLAKFVLNDVPHALGILEPETTQTESTIVYGNRTRYIPETDTVEIDIRPGAPPYNIALAHELGHRDCIIRGLIPVKLKTRGDEVTAETCAWRYAADYLRKRGQWDDFAKEWAKKGLRAHGIYWDNYGKLNRLVESL